MDKISGLLDRFKNLDQEDKKIRQAVFTVVKNKLGIELDDNEIKFVRGVIYLKTGGVIKSEIFLNKEEILNEIKEKLSSKTILDIK